MSAYQADDYIANLRNKSFQQREDDGVPSGQDKEEGSTSLVVSNASSKVQAMAHILQKSEGGDFRLHGQNVPSFLFDFLSHVVVYIQYFYIFGFP